MIYATVLNLIKILGAFFIAMFFEIYFVFWAVCIIFIINMQYVTNELIANNILARNRLLTLPLNDMNVSFFIGGLISTAIVSYYDIVSAVFCFSVFMYSSFCVVRLMKAREILQKRK